LFNFEKIFHLHILLRRFAEKLKKLIVSNLAAGETTTGTSNSSGIPFLFVRKICFERADSATPLMEPNPQHAVRPLQAEEPAVLPAPNILDHFQVIPIVVNPIHRTCPVIPHVASAVAVHVGTINSSMKCH
jgi:hypothetical protein